MLSYQLVLVKNSVYLTIEWWCNPLSLGGIRDLHAYRIPMDSMLNTRIPKMFQVHPMRLVVVEIVSTIEASRLKLQLVASLFRPALIGLRKEPALRWHFITRTSEPHYLSPTHYFCHQPFNSSIHNIEDILTTQTFSIVSIKISSLSLWASLQQNEATVAPTSSLRWE